MASFDRRLRRELSRDATIVAEPKPTPVPTPIPAGREPPVREWDVTVGPGADGAGRANQVRLLMPGPHGGRAVEREIDITHALTAVIACELWNARGGTSEANWIEAERLLDRLTAAAPLATLAPDRRQDPVGMEPAAP